MLQQFGRKGGRKIFCPIMRIKVGNGRYHKLRKFLDRFWMTKESVFESRYG
jgi:hypothetical protein